MADAFILNQVPTGYGNGWWLLIGMLISAGHTVKSSGDGLSAFSSSGSVFSNNGATGANGFGNNLAWIRLQNPDGREWVFQTNNTNGLRIKYSPSVHFTGGAPSATQTPSATDEQYTAGGGTDGAPSYFTNLLGGGVAGGTVKFQGGARGTSPYAWWMAAANTGGGSLVTGMVFDPVTGVAADNDQAIQLTYSTNAFSASNMQTITAPGGTGQGQFGFMDAAKTQFVGVCMLGYTSNTGGAQDKAGGSTNSFNGNIDGLPIYYERPPSAAAPVGGKGWSTVMRWTGVARTTFIDTAGSKTWIVANSVYLFWDGVTTPTN